MSNVEVKLTPDQQTGKVEFMGKLSPEDQLNVNSVIAIVNKLAEMSFTRGVLADYPDYSLAEANGWAFCRENDGDTFRKSYGDGVTSIHVGPPPPIIGTPFFAVYGIGGYVTKEGERKDVDLLIATNTGYPVSLNDLPDGMTHDPLLEDIESEFGTRATIKIVSGDDEDRLPDNYNLGKSKGKGLIEIAMTDGSKPIHITFVTSMHSSPGHISSRFIDSDGDHVFITRDEFETRLDVYTTEDSENQQIPAGYSIGDQIPRLLLYQATQG